jgi:hypothetical protein
MQRRQHMLVCRCVIWTLLSLWTIFAGCELAEATQLIEEVVAESVGGQDLDEQSLLQLASTPKSESQSASPLQFVSLVITALVFISPLHVSPANKPAHWLILHDPPGLPLYQRLSVYRI